MSLSQVRIRRDVLERFCQAVFQQVGLSQGDAEISAEVLVAADTRAIPSHGVARLWRYVNGLKTGLMRPDAEPEVIKETPTSLVIDAHGAMGAPVSVRTMEQLIEKAGLSGIGFGCVRDSNHFGIAGYYAMLALDADMLGLAMTNTAALGVPTFGGKAMYGTNPLAFAAPAHEEHAFVLDMSTTTVTRGTIEVCHRQGKPLAPGWAVDETGSTTTDAGRVLEALSHRVGGLLPLGGAGELLGGHKGYGLAVMVDILSAVLCGASFGPQVADTETSSARVSHFFGAIAIDRFRDPQAFRRDMDSMLQQLRETPVAAGAERIYVAGEKEFQHEAEVAERGVPLTVKVYERICAIGSEQGVDPPPVLSEGFASASGPPG